MKALVVDRFGGSELFRLQDIPTPTPGPGEVLIRVAYASVNPADCKMRAGMLTHLRNFSFPFVAGFDAAGIVASIGPGVHGFKPGDRVNTLSDQLAGTHGSYADHVCARAGRFQHLPEDMSFRDGASIPVGGATAYGAVVDLGTARAGDRVFVNGGAGGVGLFALQIAKALGATVATTCSPRNNDIVRQYGADLTIDYTSKDVIAALRAWAPDGVDLIVDSIGLGSLPPDTAKVVKKGGKIVSIYTGVKDAEGFDAEVTKQCGVELIPNLTGLERQNDHLKGVMDGFRAKTLRIPPLTEFPLEQAGEAHRLVEAAHVRGKIVLKVSDL